MTDAVLSAVHVFTQNTTSLRKQGIIIFSSLGMKELKGKKLSHGHIRSKWQSGDPKI